MKSPATTLRTAMNPSSSSSLRALPVQISGRSLDRLSRCLRFYRKAIELLMELLVFRAQYFVLSCQLLLLLSLDQEPLLKKQDLFRQRLGSLYRRIDLLLEERDALALDLHGPRVNKKDPELFEQGKRIHPAHPSTTTEEAKA